MREPRLACGHLGPQTPAPCRPLWLQPLGSTAAQGGAGSQAGRCMPGCGCGHHGVCVVGRDRVAGAARSGAPQPLEPLWQGLRGNTVQRLALLVLDWPGSSLPFSSLGPCLLCTPRFLKSPGGVLVCPNPAGACLCPSCPSSGHKASQAPAGINKPRILVEELFDISVALECKRVLLCTNSNPSWASLVLETNLLLMSVCGLPVVSSEPAGNASVTRLHRTACAAGPAVTPAPPAGMPRARRSAPHTG